VTGPRSTGIGARRSPVPWLLVPAALILLAAALTPANELTHNQGDVSLYFENARAIVGGRVPYRDVSLEYPPLALISMVLPYLVGSAFGELTLERYAWLFASWEALLVLVLGYVLVKIARLGGLETRQRDPGWTVAWRLPIIVAGAALAIAWRFDLLAADLLALAVWATLADGPMSAGLALGLGVLAKLFPVVAAPWLAIAWLVPKGTERLARFGLASAATVAAGILLFVAVAGPAALSFLGYQAQRGLEIESIGAGAVLLDGLIQGQVVETHSPFKAVEVFGPFAEAWLRLLPAMTVAWFGALAVAAWRAVRRDVAAARRASPGTLTTLAGASVMVVLVTSKVFSIQYVVWLVPFVALLPPRKFWLGAAIVALTMPIHPFLFAGLVRQEVVPVLVLNLRNALLFALALWVIVDLWRGSAPGRRLPRAD
jgi:hypothetical protein